jgi:hypothetical protein
MHLGGPKKRFMPFMANIPGAMNYLPGYDPVIPIILGESDGRLITNDWGTKFEIEGDIRLAALAALKYGLFFKENGSLGVSFSCLTFDFDNGLIVIKPRYDKPTTDVLQFISEMKKILNLKAFL